MGKKNDERKKAKQQERERVAQQVLELQQRVKTANQVRAKKET